jgi:1-acyl-sn-glycerol-3-phosphate acyltransferase
MNKPVYPVWASITPIGRYETVKIFLATVTLIAPVRFIVIWILLIIGWLLTLPIRPWVDAYAVGSAYKTVVMLLIRVGCRLILFVAGFYWIPSRGHFDPRATILVSTHKSLWDALWIIWKAGAAQTAKADLFRMPVISGFLFALDSVPIDRHSRKGKREALAAIRFRASSTGSRPLLIFPTAICSNDRQLPEFKRGAFEPRLPVQPIGISYPSRFYDHTLGRWPLWDMFRATCQAINFMTITFLPLRTPTEREMSDPEIFKENVRYEMGAHLGMQLTKYSFETDCVRIRCRTKGIFFNETKCEVHNLPLTLSVIDAFDVFDQDRDGWIGGRDAAKAGRRFLYSFAAAFNTLKLPPRDSEAYESARETIHAWMDVGIVGVITGGRPLLPIRKADPFEPEKIEVAEVITYFNKLLVSKHEKPCPVLADAFNVSQYFHGLELSS